MAIDKLFIVRISGLMLALISTVILITQTLVDQKIAKKGDLIEGLIMEIPECCDCKNIYSSFKYKDVRFNKKVWKEFCLNNKVGDAVLFFHTEAYPNKFIFQSFKPTYLLLEIISNCVLIFAGILMFLYSIVKSESSV